MNSEACIDKIESHCKDFNNDWIKKYSHLFDTYEPIPYQQMQQAYCRVLDIIYDYKHGN